MMHNAYKVKKENTVAVILYFCMVVWDLQIFRNFGNVLTSSTGFFMFVLKATGLLLRAACDATHLKERVGGNVFFFNLGKPIALVRKSDYSKLT